jgi:hypothetical protein
MKVKFQSEYSIQRVKMSRSGKEVPWESFIHVCLHPKPTVRLRQVNAILFNVWKGKLNQKLLQYIVINLAI